MFLFVLLVYYGIHREDDVFWFSGVGEISVYRDAQRYRSDLKSAYIKYGRRFGEGNEARLMYDELESLRA